MKRELLYFIIVFILSGVSIKAQKIPDFKQKMYVDSLNRLFVNKAQPIYLWLSTSNNRDSAVLLQSHESKDYVNPFYFDTEGLNTVRTPSKVDKKTRKVVIPKSDIIFEVYADGISPVSYIHFSGAKKYIKNGKIYYGKGLTFHLTAKDGVSGVQNIYYSINGADYQKFTKNILFEKEGKVIFKYFSVDHVGNVEKVKTKNFYIDLSPPVIKQEKTGTTTGNVLSKNSKIILTATDELSGVKNIMYSIDGKTPVVYKNPIPAYWLGGGEHKFNYYAVDNVGNTGLADGDAGIEYNTTYIYDNEGPDVQLNSSGGCSYKKNNILYLSMDCKLSFDATDDFTAVKKIEYGLNSKVNFTEFTDDFTLSDENKNYALYYKAQDVLGNSSKLYYQHIVVDNQPPTTWIKYGTPQFFDRDTLFISDKTKISLFSKDAFSGVKKIEYKIKNNPFTEYQKTFTIGQYGYSVISFQATDNVNNVEKTKSSSVVVDNLPPQIYLRFSIESVGTKEHNGKILNVYPKYSKIYIAATDKNSGTSKILYSINDAPFVNYATNNQIAKGGIFTKSGFYKIIIKAFDKLGNESIHEEDFYIE